MLAWGSLASAATDPTVIVVQNNERHPLRLILPGPYAITLAPGRNLIPPRVWECAKHMRAVQDWLAAPTVNPRAVGLTMLVELDVGEEEEPTGSSPGRP